MPWLFSTMFLCKSPARQGRGDSLLEACITCILTFWDGYESGRFARFVCIFLTGSLLNCSLSLSLSLVFMYYFDNPGGQIPSWVINWAAKVRPQEARWVVCLTAVYLACGAVSLKRCAISGLMMLFYETAWLMDYVRSVVANTQDRGWDKRQTLEGMPAPPALHQDPSRITFQNLPNSSLFLVGTRVPGTLYLLMEELV